MRTKSVRKWSRKLLFLPLLVFLLGMLIPLVAPRIAYAYEDNDSFKIGKQQDRTEVAAIARCFELSSGLAPQVSPSDLNQQAIWGTIHEPDGNENQIPVGYEIDPDNGIRECQNLDFNALSFVGLSWEEFWKTAYGNSPGSDNNYHLKPGKSEELRKKILDGLKANRDSADSLVGPKEKDRRILIGLSHCIETVPEDRAPTGQIVDKQGYPKGKYQFRDGMDGGDTIPVGQDLTFYNDDNDGTYTCDTLINLGKNAINDLPNGKTLEDVTGTAGGAGRGNDGGGVGTQEMTCDIAATNPLTWVVCPVVDMMVFAISKTDKLITEQMSIETSSIFCTGGSNSDDSCHAYYTAWSTFRNLALGLLVIVGLIIVIAQAVGAEILDAYAIRKTLPRLLIAAIGITLSWPLMNFAVTLSNNLGFGIRDLIVAPFESFTSQVNLSFTDSWTNALIGTGAVAGAIPAWIAFGGLGVLVSYVATAGLAVLVAVLVLIIRQILIVMLILLAPLAFIAYVMPNTQRAFRLWWEAFSRALLMFPLIAAFIATGRVIAAISLQSGGVVNGIIGFVAYFGPYFLIPLTFQFSGSIMGGVGNFIQQRAQGAQGALSGYRGNQRETRVKRARTEGLYRNGFGRFKFRPGGKQRSVGSALNTVGFWGLNADEMIPYKLGTTHMMGMKKKAGIPGFRRGGHELHSEIKRARRDQTMQGVQDLDIGYKSGRLMAGEFQYYHSGLTSEGHQMLMDKFGTVDDNGNFKGYRAPENWGERQKVADIFTNHTKGQDPVTGQWDAKGIEAREAGAEMKATASEFEKYTKSPETNRVDGRLLGLVSAAKAGRLEMSDVVNNHNRLMESGDQENALRETTILQDALTAKRVSAARGHSIWYDTKGKAHSSYEDPASEKAQTSLMRINTQEIAGSKSEDVDALRETLVAGASDYQMEYNPETKQVQAKRGADGHPLRKDPDSIDAKRVKEIRGRIKTLAMYNSGDSDVGRKVRDIWVDRLQLPESQLEWGSGHSNDPHELVLAGLGGKPPEPPAAGGQSGGGGTPQPPV